MSSCWMPAEFWADYETRLANYVVAHVRDAANHDGVI